MLSSSLTGNNYNGTEKPRILVKCGGFSSQLARNVSEQVDGDPLWGSRFDQTQPEAVIRTHLDFLHSGADIILTNTYQSSVEGFMRHLGTTREQSVALIEKSVVLARQAKSQYLAELAAINGNIGPNMPIILASIGPYGAYLHDGSEYKGSYANLVTHDELQKWHTTRIETCLKAGADGLAVETLPCQMEALAVTELVLKNYTAKFWVSFQCKVRRITFTPSLFYSHSLILSLGRTASGAWRTLCTGCTGCLAFGIKARSTITSARSGRELCQSQACDAAIQIISGCIVV